MTAGDGYRGMPAGAPYDAILATGAISHVPPAWIRQWRPGGRLVAPLAGGHEAALMLFVKVAEDELVGRFDRNEWRSCRCARI